MGSAGGCVTHPESQRADACAPVPAQPGADARGRRPEIEDEPRRPRRDAQASCGAVPIFARGTRGREASLEAAVALQPTAALRI
jgi:hypothetical protein